MRIYLMLSALLLMCGTNHLNAEAMNNKYVPEEYVVIAQNIRADLAKKLSKKHHMTVVGITGGLARCVNVLGLRFDIQGPLTKEQIRNILIDCVEEFLTTINLNEKLRPHLKQFPFTAKEIDIGLFIVDNHKHEIFDPCIGTATAVAGKLRYYSVSKDDLFTLKQVAEEDYDTALQLVLQDKASLK